MYRSQLPGVLLLLCFFSCLWEAGTWYAVKKIACRYCACSRKTRDCWRHNYPPHGANERSSRRNGDRENTRCLCGDWRLIIIRSVSSTNRTPMMSRMTWEIGAEIFIPNPKSLRAHTKIELRTSHAAGAAPISLTHPMKNTQYIATDATRGLAPSCL